MDEARFGVLHNQVCESWKRLEQHRLAYSAGAKAIKRRSDRLNWATVVLGGCTGITGLLSVVPAVGLSTVVTALIGAGTGVSVALKQTFNWEEKAKKLWDGFIDLDNAQRDLQRYISDVAMYGAERVDPVYIQKLDEKLRPIFAIEVNDIDKFEEAAESSLRRNFVSTLKIAVQGQGAEAVAAPEAQAEEAEVEGIKPMLRGDVDELSSEE